MTLASRVSLRIVLIAGVQLSAWALGITTTARSSYGADAITVETVRTAWDKRHVLITSFQYDCALEDAVVVSTVPFDQNPFGERPQPREPSEGRVLRKTAVFVVSGGKLAYRELGDYWDAQKKEVAVSTFKAAFDGVQNMSVNDGGPMALGEIATSKTASDFLLVHSNQYALWMWYSPAEFLERYRGGVKTMRIENQHSRCDGRDCIELAIRQPAWVTTIYVDPARAFLPVHVAERHEGMLVHEVSIEYRSHDTMGWTVSDWTSKEFSKMGGVTNSITTGRVAKRAINEPIADDTFDLAFPAGSHIVERNGAKTNYFVQMANGSRRAISEAEYGRVPSKP